MKRNVGRFRPILIALFGVLFIFASGCGSGGGGSTGVGYRGSLDKAVIDSSKADGIMSAFYGNYTVGEETGSELRKVSPENYANHNSRMFILDLYTGAMSVIHSGESVDVLAGKNILGKQLAATVSETSELSSTCPDVTGSADISTKTDDQSGDISGTVTYTDYCDDVNTAGMTYSGTMTFSSSGDGSSEQVSFSDLIITDGTTTLGLDGAIAIQNPDERTTEVDMTLTMEDRENKKSYWFKNLHLSVTALNEDWSIVDFDISGQFYHSDYGYVDIKTPAPLRFSDAAEFPISGAITATGAPGSGGGSTSAKLTSYYDSGTCYYRLRVDVNGDGTFDSSTGLLLWEDLIS